PRDATRATGPEWSVYGAGVSFKVRIGTSRRVTRSPDRGVSDLERPDLDLPAPYAHVERGLRGRRRPAQELAVSQPERAAVARAADRPPLHGAPHQRAAGMVAGVVDRREAVALAVQQDGAAAGVHPPRVALAEVVQRHGGRPVGRALREGGVVDARTL